MVKNLPAMWETLGREDPLEKGRSPGEGKSNPLQLFLLGEFHGQRSPVGHSPWGSQRVGHE